MRVGRADDLNAGSQRLADVLATQIEAWGEAVDLDRDSLLERDLEDPLEVDRVLGTAVDIAAGRVAEATHVRVEQRLLDTPRHLGRGHPLATVDAGLNPVELSEDVVGEVEPPVAQDVAFDTREHPERSEQLVGGGDLLAAGGRRRG